jgi:hypothetical protein
MLMTFTTTHMAKHVVKFFAIFWVLGVPKIKKKHTLIGDDAIQF